ncbi:MAG: alanine racemase [Candidatus Limnocylindrales bacterium]
MTAPHPASIEARLAAARLPPLPRLAWLELDLDALSANLATVRVLAGAVPVYPVVKADAYGHGALPIARALAAAGADGFCVATMDEALALRAGGIGEPIRVLYPVPPAFAADAARRGIAVAAGDPDLLEAFIVAAEAAGVGAGRRRRVGIEVEVETGLGRGGFDRSTLVAAARRIEGSPAVRLAGLWTHLQASEDATLTAAQLDRFDAAAADIRAAGIPLPVRHVAASGGLLTEVTALDGVRPGLAIYGIVPDELDGEDPPLPAGAAFRPVMSIHARPVRVADLPAGHGISYGPTFTTVRPSRIATLPLGYGDGFTRANSNRAEALVRGRRVPLVGNVAMDACMFDVTDVPGRPVGTDDEFVLLGAQGNDRISAEDLARTRTTNTWEVVTQMAARLPRVYHAAAAAVGLRTLSERRG